MSGHGLAWSLLLASVLTVASIPVLATTAGSAAQVADRAVLGGLAGLLVARAGAVILGDGAIANATDGLGGDPEFWFVATVTIFAAAWAPKPGRRRKQLDRAAAISPCVLVGYATYEILCPIRRHCANGGIGWGPGLEVGFGVALIAVAVVLRFAWTITATERLATCLVALAASRSLLALFDGDRSLSSAFTSLLVTLFAGLVVARGALHAVRARAERRRFAERRSVAAPLQQGPSARTPGQGKRS